MLFPYERIGRAVKQRAQTQLEREENRRAKRLVEGLGELWEAEEPADSEQSLRALHEIIDQ